MSLIFIPFLYLALSLFFSVDNSRNHILRSKPPNFLCGRHIPSNISCAVPLPVVNYPCALIPALESVLGLIVL
jgi:hypothetical protein